MASRGSVVIALLLAAAPAAAASADPQPGYGPELGPPSDDQAKPAEPNCAAQAVANPNAIVVCAQRPQGYRLNRDILEAKREKQRQDAGRPTRPGVLTDNSCKMVGPMGCRPIMGGINVLAAAATAAEMADRLSKGEEIGSMFVTDPQKSEYELYAEAKKRREAAEAAAAAKAKVKATVEP